MHDQAPTKNAEATSNNQEKENSVRREQRAIREAFAPSGVSGERLDAVTAAFDEALNKGKSYDAAINDAILEAKVIGSSLVELKSYFWDSMDPNRLEGEQPTRAIDRALSGLGLDDERLARSKTTFTSALLQNWQYVNDWIHDGKEHSPITEDDIPYLADMNYPLDAALLRATNQDIETPANKAAHERFYAGIDPNRGRDDQPKNQTQLHLGEFAADHIQ